MKLEAICSTCGRNFLLSQLVDQQQPRCPFCGTRFGRHYVALMPESVAAVESAAEEFAGAVKKINDSSLGFAIDFPKFLDRLLEDLRESSHF